MLIGFPSFLDCMPFHTPLLPMVTYPSAGLEYSMSLRTPAHPRPTNSEISAYWDSRIHDTVLSQDPPGSPGFYAAMDAYRYGRLDYLSDLVDFGRWRARDVLDLGCGAGLDLVRFARAGARVVGVDLSAGALAMASDYLGVSGLKASLVHADAAQLPFAQASFDLVFCHGVLSFVRDDNAVVAEVRRILRPDGLAILMVYNRRSAMYMAHRFVGLPLGHADAPGFRTHTRAEFEALLAPLGSCEIRYERLPATTSQRTGPGATLFNAALRIARRALPEAWFRAAGWHLIARCGVAETRGHDLDDDVSADGMSERQR
jgi:SAM-dependent methyltransferase